MSSFGQYYEVAEIGGEFVTRYDSDQHLSGPSFKTRQEATDFIKADNEAYRQWELRCGMTETECPTCHHIEKDYSNFKPDYNNYK